MQTQEWRDRYGSIRSAFSNVITGQRDQILAGASADEIVAQLKASRYAWLPFVAIEERIGHFRWNPDFLEALQYRSVCEQILSGLQLDESIPWPEQRRIMLDALVPILQQQDYSSHEIEGFVEGLFSIGGGIARHRLREWAEAKRLGSASEDR